MTFAPRDGAQRTPCGVLAGALARAGLDWIVPDWPAPSNVSALFTTRNAAGDARLDIGPARLDRIDPLARAAILRNRDEVRAFLPASPHYLEQVHDRAVVLLDRLADPGKVHVADAAVTRDAGVVLAIRVADCLPVLLADRQGRVVAAAHAGWRGLVAGVLEAAVRSMDTDPHELIAWIGPAIGPTAFEVGDEVRQAYAAAEPADSRFFVPHAEGKWLADLPALAHARLARMHVPRVAHAALCTHADAKRFFSYRRDQSSARMAAFVWRD